MDDNNHMEKRTGEIKMKTFTESDFKGTFNQRKFASDIANSARRHVASQLESAEGWATRHPDKQERGAELISKAKLALDDFDSKFDKRLSAKSIIEAKIDANSPVGKFKIDLSRI